MVNVETLLDGLFVVVASSALLSAEQEALHQFVFRHVQLNHGCHLVSAFGKHLFQGFCLRDSAGETVEDDTLMLLAETVVNTGEDINHQFIGDELSVVDIAFGCLAQFCSVLDLAAEHVARRDVVETILLNHLVALRAFACTWSAENYDILHLLV